MAGDVLAGLTLAFQLWSQRQGGESGEKLPVLVRHGTGLGESGERLSVLTRRLDLACAFAACEVPPSTPGCFRADLRWSLTET